MREARNAANKIFSCRRPSCCHLRHGLIWQIQISEFQKIPLCLSVRTVPIQGGDSTEKVCHYLPNILLTGSIAQLTSGSTHFPDF